MKQKTIFEELRDSNNSLFVEIMKLQPKKQKAIIDLLNKAHEDGKMELIISKVEQISLEECSKVAQVYSRSKNASEFKKLLLEEASLSEKNKLKEIKQFDLSKIDMTNIDFENFVLNKENCIKCNEIDYKLNSKDKKFSHLFEM